MSRFSQLREPKTMSLSTLDGQETVGEGWKRALRKKVRVPKISVKTIIAEIIGTWKYRMRFRATAFLSATLNAVIALLVTAIVIALSFIEEHRNDVEAATMNLYHEARGVQGVGGIGLRVVMSSVWNRVESSDFPNTVSEVVYQTSHGGKRCQYSWWCDGKSDTPTELETYSQIEWIAWWYFVEYHLGVWKDPTNGSRWYHSAKMLPDRFFLTKLCATVPFVEPDHANGGWKGHLFYDLC